MSVQSEPCALFHSSGKSSRQVEALPLPVRRASRATQVRSVHKVSKDFRASKAFKEFKDRPERQVLREFRASQDQLEPLAHKGQQDRLAHRVTPERREQTAPFPDRPDLRVQLVHKEPRVHPEPTRPCPVQLVLKDQLALLDRPDHPERIQPCPDRQVHEEQLDQQDRQGHRASPDRQVQVVAVVVELVRQRRSRRRLLLVRSTRARLRWLRLSY